MKGQSALKTPAAYSTNDAQPAVAVLLYTYNGERYLPEQLESFEQQTHANWLIWASDDSSSDNTLALLETYRKKWPAGKLSIV